MSLVGASSHQSGSAVSRRSILIVTTYVGRTSTSLALSGTPHTCLHDHTGTLNSVKMLSVRGNGTRADADPLGERKCESEGTPLAFFKPVHSVK